MGRGGYTLFALLSILSMVLILSSAAARTRWPSTPRSVFDPDRRRLVRIRETSLEGLPRAMIAKRQAQIAAAEAGAGARPIALGDGQESTLTPGAADQAIST